jgi:hypothetical protein
MDRLLGKRIVALKNAIVGKFNHDHWKEVGILTGHAEEITGHDRLLRSLSFGDDDYPGNVLEVLSGIAKADLPAFEHIEEFVAEHFPDDAEYVSAKSTERRITFTPNVFNVPSAGQEPDLVVAMMPFNAEFIPVYEALGRACGDAGLRCLRADDIWEDSIIIQDIFNLIFRAHIVIVDFTGKNPNVMYETGIAHTLGRHVVPIAQSIEDVPFDLKHHRVLKYHDNEQGRKRLQEQLQQRLQQLRSV